MARSAWVRDKVIDVLRDDPNTGAAKLKELEKKYNIQPVILCRMGWKTNGNGTDHGKME
jgi:hypothetical protein